MPIVKRIVTEHSAEMDCQSAENVGTTVRIRFPYNPIAPSEDLVTASVSAPVAEKPEELTTPETKERTIDPQA